MKKLYIRNKLKIMGSQVSKAGRALDRISPSLPFPGDSDSNESACSAGDLRLILGREGLLEKEMATHLHGPNLLGCNLMLPLLLHDRSWPAVKQPDLQKQDTAPARVDVP